MIRLSQLFKRDSQSEDGLRDATTRSRSDNKFITRNSRITADDPVLTEDPEHQRARHRLIGAAVLVLVAIVVLPRVLDSKPKSISNDIAVTIVSSLQPAATPQLTPAPSTAESKSEEVRTATPPAPPAIAATNSKESSKSTPPNVTAPSPTKALTPSSPDKTLGLAAGEEIVITARPNSSDPTGASSSNSGKFVVQIGAFASEERANGWITKLKEQKIPNYVLNRTGTDGSKLYALRAGPFPDKETAEAAEKKIKAMGLTPRVVEVGKQ